jgi:hypothetical protein
MQTIRYAIGCMCILLGYFFPQALRIIFIYIVTYYCPGRVWIDY